MEIRIVIDDRIVNLCRRVLTRRRLATLAVTVALLPLALYAQSQIGEHGLWVFQPEDVIKSAEVNENFEILGEHMTTYDSAIAVDGEGNVGIGTSNPYSSLEVSDSTGSGLTISIGNERTLLETSPDGRFMIRPNNRETPPTFVVDDDTGNVGIGTTSPSQLLSVVGGNIELTSRDGASGGFLAWDGQTGELRLKAKSGKALALGANLSHGQLFLDTNGNVGIGTTSPQYPLHMASGAHVTAGGVWTDASSRELKDNIRELELEEAVSALETLRPTRFRYKRDPGEEQLGFIAEEVPELVAMNDRKGLSAMDIAAVLTRVTQEQQKRIEQQQMLIHQQGAQLETLMQEVALLKQRSDGGR